MSESSAHRLIHIVLVNSVLWTAGSGGFLNYFVLELGASAASLGPIAAMPKTFGISGLATRRLFRWGLPRKTLYLGTSLTARAASLIIPLLAFPLFHAESPSRVGRLFGAFFCWGAFGAVNVAGPNLMLGYAPRGDSAIHLALFHQVAGSLAGLTRILGGVWLDFLLRTKVEWRWHETIVLSGFHAIFLVSWIGRLLAAACVIPVREKCVRPEDQ